MIRHAHRLTGKEPVDFAIPPVDFCMMACAVGAEAYTIRRPEDLVRIDFAPYARKSSPPCWMFILTRMSRRLWGCFRKVTVYRFTGSKIRVSPVM
jgi:hypothetical protein